MKKLDENQLTMEIKGLIQRKAEHLIEGDLEYKEKYDYLKSEILQIFYEAEALKEDMEKNGLTSSSLEAEGYLRCAITIKHLLED